MNVTEAEAAPSTSQFNFSSNNEDSYSVMAVLERRMIGPIDTSSNGVRINPLSRGSY